MQGERCGKITMVIRDTKDWSSGEGIEKDVMGR